MLGKLVVLIIAVILIVAGLFTFQNYNNPNRSPLSIFSPMTTSKSDPNRPKILLNEEELTFTNGLYKSDEKSQTQHSASLTNQTTSSTKTRSALILVDNPSGSGTFYYLVGSILKDGKISYSSPMLLGDRIIIQSLVVEDPGANDNGLVTVSYLDRSKDQALSEEPKEPATAKFAFQEDGSLIPVLN